MNKKRAIKSPFQQTLAELMAILALTLGLFLLLDFFGGAWLLSKMKPADAFRTRHPIYHHTLKPNFDGLGYWGSWSYRVCTDGEGFKTQCESRPPASKTFDVAFLGDSFTEGVGLPYEQTFVGMVAAQTPGIKIANLGVVSYSPSIYLAKLKALYAKGYAFKHLVVLIDIGDVYDEANSYDLHDESIVVDKGERHPLSVAQQLRRRLLQYFPLTGEAWFLILKISGAKNNVRDNRDVMRSQPETTVLVEAPIVATVKPALAATPLTAELPGPMPARPGLAQPHPSANADPEKPFLKNIYEGIYLKNYPKSEWTYNSQSTHYGAEGVAGTIAKIEKQMLALYDLARSNGTKLSIGVYPWPGQIKYDVVESQQVKIWRNFCQTRCEHFYNMFPVFFDLAQELGPEAFVYQYYFQGDVHFNERGNEVIARTLLSIGIK
jgi:hypothetical protein